jgi:hypothetical protein
MEDKVVHRVRVDIRHAVTTVRDHLITTRGVLIPVHDLIITRTMDRVQAHAHTTMVRDHLIITRVVLMRDHVRTIILAADQMDRLVVHGRR